MKETIVKINQTKSWIIKKINKMDKPLARLIKKKERRITPKLQVKRRGYNRQCRNTKDYDYYEWLYGNKLDNLEEMDRFLEKFNLPRPNQEGIEIMDNTITSTEMKLWSNISQNTKAQDQMASKENSVKHLNKS